MLTTVPGIGITLAAALYAESGDPNCQRCLKRMSSYAGLVARLKQTGGPDKEAWTQGTSGRRGREYLAGGCTPLVLCSGCSQNLDLLFKPITHLVPLDIEVEAVLKVHPELSRHPKVPP